MAARLGKHYKVLYKGTHGLVAHEFIIDLRSFKESAGINSHLPLLTRSPLCPYPSPLNPYPPHLSTLIPHPSSLTPSPLLLPPHPFFLTPSSLTPSPPLPFCSLFRRRNRSWGSREEADGLRIPLTYNVFPWYAGGREGEGGEKEREEVEK